MLDKITIARSNSGQFLNLAVFLLLAIFLSSNLLDYFRAFTAMPFWDMWSNIDLWQKYDAGDLDFREFWKQHNEHRIFIARILFLIDYVLFSASQIFPLVLNVIFSIGIFLVILKSSSLRIPTAINVLLAAAITFSPAQQENVAWAFQTQFYLPIFLCLLAIKYSLDGELKDFGLSLFFCTIASLAMSYGLLVFPVVILSGIINRYSARRFLIAALLFATTVTFYFYGYTKPVRHPSLLIPLFNPFVLYDYLSLFFLSTIPWLSDSATYRRIIFGIITIFVSWQFFVHVFKASSTNTSRQTKFFLLTCIFCFSTATLIAIARAGFGESQAASSRYNIISITFLVSFVLLCCEILRLRQFVDARKLRIGAVLTISLMALGSQVDYSYDHRIRIAKQADFIAALWKLGLAPRSENLMFHPSPELVYKGLEYMEERGVGVFSINNDIFNVIESKTLSQSELPKCQGEISSVSLIDSYNYSMALLISGWLVTPNGNVQGEHYLAVGDNGEVMGLSRPYVRRPDIEQALKTQSQVNLFLLYAKAGAAELGLNIVAVDKYGNALCRYRPESSLFSNIPQPVEWLDNNTKRYEINDMVETPDGMRENGFYPGAFSDPFSFCEGRRIWGSHKQAHTDVGSITFEFPDPWVELGLPVLTGPGFGGRTVTLMANGADEEKFGIPRPIERGTKLAKLRRSDSLPITKLIVSDTGTSWAQWIAVCAPVGINPGPQ